MTSKRITEKLKRHFSDIEAECSFTWNKAEEFRNKGNEEKVLFWEERNRRAMHTWNELASILVEIGESETVYGKEEG